MTFKVVAITGYIQIHKNDPISTLNRFQNVIRLVNGRLAALQIVKEPIYGINDIRKVRTLFKAGQFLETRDSIVSLAMTEILSTQLGFNKDNSDGLLCHVRTDQIREFISLECLQSRNFEGSKMGFVMTVI